MYKSSITWSKTIKNENVDASRASVIISWNLTQEREESVDMSKSHRIVNQLLDIAPMFSYPCMPLESWLQNNICSLLGWTRLPRQDSCRRCRTPSGSHPESPTVAFVFVWTFEITRLVTDPWECTSPAAIVCLWKTSNRGTPVYHTHLHESHQSTNINTLTIF